MCYKKMEVSFCGQRALVTGATRGIGRAIALQLSKCGAKVVAIGRSNDQPDWSDSLKKEDRNIETVELDITDWKRTEMVLKDCGPVDLLVNNAGVTLYKPITELTEEDVDRVFAVNIKAVVNVTKLVVRNLLGRNSPGAVVTLSSRASRSGLLNRSVYCASKGAVDAFTRAAALEYGPMGIRVNAVNPTVIMTEMTRVRWANPEDVKAMVQTIPLRRFVEVREVTDAVLFLLSDKSSMISGVCLPVDGGSIAT